VQLRVDRCHADLARRATGAVDDTDRAAGDGDVVHGALAGDGKDVVGADRVRQQASTFTRPEASRTMLITGCSSRRVPSTVPCASAPTSTVNFAADAVSSGSPPSGSRTSSPARSTEGPPFSVSAMLSIWPCHRARTAGARWRRLRDDRRSPRAKDGGAEAGEDDRDARRELPQASRRRVDVGHAGAGAKMSSWVQVGQNAT